MGASPDRFANREETHADHVTIRNHTADLTKFDAFGYGINKATPPATGGVSDVHYLVFSR